MFAVLAVSMSTAILVLRCRTPPFDDRVLVREEVKRVLRCHLLAMAFYVAFAVSFSLESARPSLAPLTMSFYTAVHVFLGAAALLQSAWIVALARKEDGSGRTSAARHSLPAVLRSEAGFRSFMSHLFKSVLHSCK